MSDLVYKARFPSNRVEKFHPAWQVVHISRNGHILDIKVLAAICQLPGVDVVDQSSSISFSRSGAATWPQ